MDSAKNREYKRVDTGATGAFVIKEEGVYILEFTGYIVDISEGGMKVTVDDRDRERVIEVLRDNHQKQITFQAFDDCNLFGNDVSVIFGGEVDIVRQEEIDGVYSLGCKISNPTGPLKKYIEDMKVDAFLKEINGM